MDIYSVLLILCVSVAGTAFLSHAIGYRRGEVAERKKNSRAMKTILNDAYGKTNLREQIKYHQDKIGL